jgi:hypothetical protein
MGLTMPDWFFDKEMCDAIRDCAKNSAITVENAAIILSISKDLQRDVYVVKSLSNVGMPFPKISVVIKALNPLQHKL